ncbi:helix-turn-helix transcriptional regulator [Dyadobacter sp. CY261]|uniref:helix-turn-helix domain-containing protein n=1 Tax=Dyadobacter sp. CY261 TaxID=2907203 RepID=UPI001F1F0FF3|nr:response regulator transcription factor [Dyadobacter sp. CY261]MCF0071077.1 helix-turn-helix transcriptional regulator [Dyadobacter sp. CY261]
MKKQSPSIVRSVSEQHRILGLPRPSHPLVSVFNFEDMNHDHADFGVETLIMDMYCISLKRDVVGKIRYGQGYFDFDEGIMFCTGPGQVVSNISDNHRPSGWCVVFHPDFIRRHPLSLKIKGYGFFGYEVNEALHLSEKEEELIVSVIKMLLHELNSNIDSYSEQVIVAHLELLLSYAERFYNRQFITRKPVNNDVLLKLENLLSAYFNSEKLVEQGLPTVNYIADSLHFSDSYLSDLLKNLTGQNTQQHIHHYVIEKAKELLASTNLSVAEIAFRLGFGFPQSFNKLFKNKTQVTPLQYRQSFN